MGDLDGKCRERRIIRKVRYLRFQQRHDHLLEGFLQPGVSVHAVGGIGGVIVAGDLQHGLVLVDVEADGALVGELHLGQVNIQHAVEIEGISKLVGLDLSADCHQGLQIPLLQVLCLRIGQLHRGDNLRVQRSHRSQQRNQHVNNPDGLHPGIPLAPTLRAQNLPCRCRRHPPASSASCLRATQPPCTYRRGHSRSCSSRWRRSERSMALD